MMSKTLAFTPYAWAKLIYLRDIGDTEIGAFGICPTTPLLIEDVIMTKQSCSSCYVDFDDTGVAEFSEMMFERGLQPHQFSRIWIHTHPNIGASPSAKDEETFRTAFSAYDWAIMFILAKGGETYARLRINSGPGAEVLLNVTQNYKSAFPASDPASWKMEYDANWSRLVITNAKTDTSNVRTYSVTTPDTHKTPSAYGDALSPELSANTTIDTQFLQSHRYKIFDHSWNELSEYLQNKLSLACGEDDDLLDMIYIDCENNVLDTWQEAYAIYKDEINAACRLAMVEVETVTDSNLWGSGDDRDEYLGYQDFNQY